MFRIVIVGAVCTAFLSPSAPSSASEKLSSQDGDVATGQLVSNNACRMCHTTKESDNRLGPHLYKIIGRKAGSLPDYGYSSAMKSTDFVWDEAKLNRFSDSPAASPLSCRLSCLDGGTVGCRLLWSCDTFGRRC